MYHCPYCDSLNIRTKHINCTCTSYNDCYFSEDFMNEMKEDYPGEGKDMLCLQCSKRNYDITAYVCIDCGKVFAVPNEDVNVETVADKNNCHDKDKDDDDDDDDDDD